MSSQHSRPEIPPAEDLLQLPPDGGPNWNRLVFEKSPYLLQHAANPVDWHPWGPGAFEAARAADKLVFLSVGYATCHWCHVMERESFEDAEIGALMNEAFVCIKVDREERPDIDHVYMTVTQALTGSGGWPMTVIMTPEKKPFFAGTYFPRDSRHGRPGMTDLVRHISELWRNDRARLVNSAEEIARELKRVSVAFPGEDLDAAVLDEAVQEFADRFDRAHGGFGSSPKFPVPHNISFLLRHTHRTGEQAGAQMGIATLEKMARGGIWDHVGFGFHRYSTDEEWLLPHFEKMLYDQALHVIAYTEAWQMSGRAALREVAEKTIEYVLRDMTSPEGGFYCAEDADSEGEEGKFYVWTLGEVVDVLGAEEAELFCRVYTFDPNGNFHDEATGRRTGANIPHLAAPIEEIAEGLKLGVVELRGRLETARRKLFDVREKRIHPLKDDKILTDWNGLMIVALAKAGRAFGVGRYTEAAHRAAEFVTTRLVDQQGRLLKRYRTGDAGLPAHLEDYAFLAWGLVELYEATLDERWLLKADDIAARMVELFGDREKGGFFLTAHDSEELLVRSKDVYDGAIPSGNSVAALVLLKLGRMLGNPEYERIAAETMRAFAGIVRRAPSNFAQMLCAADFAVGGGGELVVAGADIDRLRREVDRRFLPRVVLMRRPEQQGSVLLQRAVYLQAMDAPQGSPLAYLCRNYACEQPTSSPEELASRLDEMAKRKTS